LKKLCALCGKRQGSHHGAHREHREIRTEGFFLRAIRIFACGSSLCFNSFPAMLPDNAGRSVLAIKFRIGAGIAFFKTFFAVTILEFFASKLCFTIRMKSAFHYFPPP
jgi:hypothetical protein